MCTPEEPTGFEARFARIHGFLRVNDVAPAFEAVREALAAARTPAERVGALFWLGKCHYIADEIDIAIVRIAEAAAAAMQADEPVWLARAQTIEARCLEAAGETLAALDLALLALQGIEQTGRHDDEVLAVRQGAVMALGNVHLQMGDLPAAMLWCQRGVELARAVGDRAALAAALDTVGCVHSDQAAAAQAAGRGDEALHHHRQAIALSTQAAELAREIGHGDYESNAVLNLAESLTLVGEATHALALLQGWARRHPQALPRQRSHHHETLGQVYLALGQAEAAVGAFEQALEACDMPAYRASATERLATALEQCGRWREALACYKQFHALQVRLSAERAQRSARVAAARLDIERERARARQLASSNQALRRRADDLVRQAHEDALTGLSNRREVDRLLQLWPRQIAVALVDVDHFKQVNDCFSHTVGDEVLRQLASIMRGSCRPRDVAARLGGEEFVLILEGADVGSAVHAAERLRTAVEAFPWETLAAGLRVTVSIGVAGASEASSGPDLLALADRRLYAAKRAGRNRVIEAG